MHSAKIIADSISPVGARLTTMEVVMPRIVLAEFNTHRMFSRNSASSRAIPVEKMLEMVRANPYTPSHWGKNQKGMQANEEADPETAEKAENCWLVAMNYACIRVEQLLELGIHKQITNRLLEPFMWHTVIVTATEWSNFFHLRNHEAAHPDIHKVAALMQDEYDKNKPELIDWGQWHLPYTTKEEKELYGVRFANPSHNLIKASVMRCARVSFMKHATASDIEADATACEKQLLTPGHMSPLEHPATPIADKYCWFGNFQGWKQYRKHIEGEADIHGFRKVQ